MPDIEDAIILAAVAHRGQTDKAGIPYITHPLRVMSMFVAPEDEDARMVAVLHDVVEDCEVTLADLRKQGYSPVVVEAIDAISRVTGRFADGRTWQQLYDGYIERVSRNALATRVKLADLRDNLDDRRESTRSLTLETIDKYRAAQAYLTRQLAALELSAKFASSKSPARPTSTAPIT